MAVCPSCQQPIEVSAKNAGALFKCPHCNSQFFIDFSGNPEVAQEHEPELPAAPAVDQVVDQAVEQENLVTEMAVEEAAPVYEMPTYEEPAAPAPEAENVFADVVDYGNSEQSSGPMAYTLTIQGLELAETFELLREAVTDSKFGWDGADLMSQVNKGELILKGLTPTKASILINRIKYLPIGLSWKQEVYGESS